MTYSGIFSRTGEGRGTAGEVLALLLVSVDILGLVVPKPSRSLVPVPQCVGDSVKTRPLSQGHPVYCEM